jgi:hypothetical protein
MRSPFGRPRRRWREVTIAILDEQAHRWRVGAENPITADEQVERDPLRESAGLVGLGGSRNIY